MLTVMDLLNQKSANIVYSVAPTTTVFNALKELSDNNIGALLVMENDSLLGIFSERDYTRKVILENRASKDLKVQDIMTSKILYVTSDKTVDECMALMTDKRVRHLPVLDNNKVVGVISIGDVVKGAIAQKDFMIDQLTNYCMGPVQP